jgi:hypothetical protein
MLECRNFELCGENFARTNHFLADAFSRFSLSKEGNPLFQVPCRTFRSESSFSPGDESVAGLPNSVAGLPNSVAGLLNSVAGLLNSVAGLPNSVAGLPNSVAGLPNSVAGLPNSVAGLPNLVPRFLKFVCAIPGLEGATEAMVRHCYPIGFDASRPPAESQG